MMRWVLVAVCVAGALVLLIAAQDASVEERLARHRNLGKAFYENPATQNEAVEEFRRALDLAPRSVREQLNYALALLRAGKTDEAVQLLEAVQQRNPKIPHTWFNLGIVWKKAGQHERALKQFEQLVKLAPEDPIAHYNLGALHKIAGNQDAAVAEFERAAQLDPSLAAPHFQLFNAYRTSGRQELAKRALATFQRIKKEQEGAAIPEDVDWSFFAEIYDPIESHAPEASVPLRFTSRTIPGAAAGVLPLEGKLLVWSETGLRLQPGGAVPGIRNVISAAAGDFNNDGAQDLAVITADGPALLVNKGGQFTKAAASLPSGRFRQALWVDYDHDYDLDLFLFGPKSVLLRNAGSAGFQDMTSQFPFVSGEAVSAVMLRVIPDTKGFDIAVSYADREGVLYRDRLQGNYAAEDIPLPAGSTHLAAADLNNDSVFELVFSTRDGIFQAPGTGTAFSRPVPVSKHTGDFAIADFQRRGSLDVSTEGNCASAAAIDLNSDSLPDVACVQSNTLRILTNQTPVPDRKWIGVRLTGVKNGILAHGAEVEVKAGSLYSKQIYKGTPLIFGLGKHAIADTVRITWPNGLIQNEIRQPAGRIHTYKEAQRLSGSCPMVWTWNGREFQYITDVLGVAPLGASAGDGEFFPVDHDEYIHIPGTALREQAGAYEVRITEELSEVAYLDQLKLIAIDRPAAMEIYTNEKFKAPPFPEFRLYGVTQRIPPVSARDEQGRDMLGRIRTKDRIYPDSFERQLSGVGTLHTLDIDFGAGAARENKGVLVLHGWVDWADGSTFLGAAQDGKGGLVAPYLQVRDEDGKWVTVIEDMGMPAGKPKTIAVDLSGKFLSASREIRIVTNLCLYWDEIFLSEDTSAPPARLRDAQLASAELRFRGFSPNRIHPKRLQPEEFAYPNPRPVSLWNPTPGRYTRYGDVLGLAEGIDDKLIVMGSGDELVLRFKALQPPPPGIKRDFLLFVDGWAKDRDANTAFGQTTEPLPFHSMRNYGDPAPVADWQKEYLTRPALRLLRPLR